MPTCRNKERGYTLLELLVALAIMGLVLVVSLPLLSGPQAGLEIRAAGSQLVRAAREARQLAIRDNRPVPISLDVTARELRIDGGPPVRLGSEELQIAFMTARSLSVGGERGSLLFFPDGSSTGGRITLAREGLSRSWEISWITGQVRQTGEANAESG